LELAQIQLLKDESVESSIPSLPKLAQVQLSNQPNKAVESTLPQTMEWVAFQHALNEVGRFREWTLKSPLSQIKAAILNQPDASPSTPTVQASRI
jgi:hypothetical protein